MQPSAEPPRAGLTISGSPSRSTSASITAAAPSSRKVSCGSARRAGVRDAGPGDHRLGDRLVERGPAGGRPRSRRTGTPSSSRTSRSAPSSPALAVQQRDHAVGPARRAASAAAGRRRRRARRPRRRPTRSASATRRPDRRDTSRSWDRPPASTTTRGGAASVRSCRARWQDVQVRSVRSGRVPGPSYAAAGRLAVRAPKVCAQLELLLDDAGQPADALADPLRRRVAVATAACAARRSRRRRTRCPGTYATRAVTARGSIALASRPVGQGHPDVEAAVRARSSWRRRACSRRAPSSIASRRSRYISRKLLIWPRQSCWREVRRDGHLGERRRAQRRRLLGQHELLADGVRGERPADPEAGREGLGERPEVDDALGLVGAQRAAAAPRRSRAGRRGCPRGPAGRPRGRSRGSRRGARRDMRDAGRVVEVRDRVEELDPPAGRLRCRDRLRAAPRGPGRRSSISTCTTSHW